MPIIGLYPVTQGSNKTISWSSVPRCTPSANDHRPESHAGSINAEAGGEVEVLLPGLSGVALGERWGTYPRIRNSHR